MDEHTYYYAQDRRVPLQKTDNYISVDIDSLDGKAQRGVVEAVEQAGEHLRRGHYLVRKQQLQHETLEQLQSSTAVSPVYRSGNYLVVVLPEVRVRESREGKLKGLRDWIGKHEDAAEVVKTVGSRITLRPKSNCGADALQLANQIHEELGAQAAEPRMMQIEESPSS